MGIERVLRSTVAAAKQRRYIVGRGRRRVGGGCSSATCCSAATRRLCIDSIAGTGSHATAGFFQFGQHQQEYVTLQQRRATRSSALRHRRAAGAARIAVHAGGRVAVADIHAHTRWRTSGCGCRCRGLGVGVHIPHPSEIHVGQQRQELEQQRLSARHESHHTSISASTSAASQYPPHATTQTQTYVVAVSKVAGWTPGTTSSASSPFPRASCGIDAQRWSSGSRRSRSTNWKSAGDANCSVHMRAAAHRNTRGAMQACRRAVMAKKACTVDRNCVSSSKPQPCTMEATPRVSHALLHLWEATQPPAHTNLQACQITTHVLAYFRRAQPLRHAVDELGAQQHVRHAQHRQAVLRADMLLRHRRRGFALMEQDVRHLVGGQLQRLQSLVRPRFACLQALDQRHSDGGGGGGASCSRRRGLQACTTSSRSSPSSRTSTSTSTNAGASTCGCPGTFSGCAGSLCAIACAASNAFGRLALPVLLGLALGGCTCVDGVDGHSVRRVTQEADGDMNVLLQLQLTLKGGVHGL